MRKMTKSCFYMQFVLSNIINFSIIGSLSFIHNIYIYIYVSLGSSPSWATRTPHCWIMGATPIHSPTRTSSQASRAVWHVPRTNLMKPRPRVTTTTTRASWCGRAGVYGHGVCNPGLSPSDCWGRDVRGISRGPDDPVMYEEYRFQE